MTTYKLVWDDFCSWYLEMVKPAKGEQISAEALDATKSIFNTLLEIMHPFMPFITEELWQNLAEREKERPLISPLGLLSKWKIRRS